VCEGEEGKVEGRYEEELRPLHFFEIRSIFLHLWLHWLEDWPLVGELSLSCPMSMNTIT
jgi:hypothetical protein